MSTKEVANQWAQMCHEGKNLECIEQLYADNIVSKEMQVTPKSKLAASKTCGTKAKNGWIVLKNSTVATFRIPWWPKTTLPVKYFNVTFKDRGRQKMEELGVFEVKDGKIVNEQFFYSMEQ